MLRASCVAGLVAFAMTSDARADSPPAPAPSTPVIKMTCEKIAQPGRMRCEVEARVEAGIAIRWGDVEIVSVPAFITPLRGRIGPHEATTHDDDTWRWALALAARERGTGDVQARVRLVTCFGTKCSAQQYATTARVEVGD